MGFEPTICAIPVKRSANWANKPTGLYVESKQIN